MKIEKLRYSKIKGVKMKKYLIPEKGNFYKANMHMHTTISDGDLTVEETKKAYLEKGYSIVAFSDHWHLVPHTELTDENFLAITSTEVSVDPKEEWSDFYRTHHLCIYSKDPYKKDYEFGKYEFSADGVNRMVQDMKKQGFIVSYNHPSWSIEDEAVYGEIKGLWGVEVHNTGCLQEGHIENELADKIYARHGERVFPLATDDAHRPYNCFGGWIMVKAENLSYDTVMTALENGDFYASQGPEIFELFIENEKLYVRCSDARRIYIVSERRKGDSVTAKDGETLTEACFDLSGYSEDTKRENNPWQPAFKIVIENKFGYRAWTRFYYLDN